MVWEMITPPNLKDKALVTLGDGDDDGGNNGDGVTLARGDLQVGSQSLLVATMLDPVQIITTSSRTPSTPYNAILHYFISYSSIHYFSIKRNLIPHCRTTQF